MVASCCLWPLFGPGGDFDWAQARHLFAVAKLSALCVLLLERSTTSNGAAIVNIAHTHNAMCWAWGTRRSIWAGSLAAIDAMPRHHTQDSHQLRLAPTTVPFLLGKSGSIQPRL